MMNVANPIIVADPIHLDKGEKLVYHMGYLAKDRAKNKRLDAFADKLWDASKDGRVHLVQRRLGFMSFEYIAVGAA